MDRRTRSPSPSVIAKAIVWSSTPSERSSRHSHPNSDRRLRPPHPCIRHAPVWSVIVTPVNFPANSSANVAFITPSPSAPKSDLYRDLLPLLKQRAHRPPKSDRSSVNCVDSNAAPHVRARTASIIPPASTTTSRTLWPVPLISSSLAERRAPVAPVQTTWRRKRADHSSPMRERIEEEMRQAVPICTIDFNLPKNQWRDLQ